MDENSYLDIGEEFDLHGKYDNLEFLNLKKILQQNIMKNTYNNCTFNNEIVINVNLIEEGSFNNCTFKKIVHINIIEESLQFNAFVNCKFDSIIYINVGNLNIFNHCQFYQIIASGVEINMDEDKMCTDDDDVNTIIDKIDDVNLSDSYTYSSVDKIKTYELANGSYVNVWFTEKLTIDVNHIYSSAFVNCIFEKDVHYVNHENVEMDIFENCTFLETFKIVDLSDEKMKDLPKDHCSGKMYILNKINEFKNKNTNRTNMLFLGLGNKI